VCYENFYLLGYNTAVQRKPNDVLEEHITFIFRDEEYTKQETSMKQASSRGDMSL
jgi:hypothetical protein